MDSVTLPRIPRQGDARNSRRRLVGGRDNHSIFAAALLRALEDNTGVLEGQELFTKIRRPVVVNSDQIPEYSDIRKAGHDGGDFLFVVP